MDTFCIFAYYNSCLEKSLLHRNEIVQYLQNFKYYKVDQDHFGKTL